MTLVTDDTPRTEWFAPDIKPVHAGFYECMYENRTCPHWSYFDGMYWSPGAPTLRVAARYKHVAGIQNRIWRGLASDPNPPHEVALDLDDLLRVL